MIEIQQEQERKVKCLLVGAPDKKNGNPEPKELQNLLNIYKMKASENAMEALNMDLKEGIFPCILSRVQLIN